MAKTRQNWTAEPWQDSEMLECTMVIPESDNCATIAFRPPSGAWFDYQPGQFLTLDLPVPGGSVQRTYTISSSPSRPQAISVTVKAQPGSVGGRWLLDQLKPGMRLRAYGPAGQFTFLRHPAAKYLFISAGSGATPLMSMTTWAWDSGEMPDIVYVHAARKPSEILFRRRLEEYASRVPGLQLRFTVEEVDPYAVWPGYHGRLSQIMLGLMAPDYLEREVFCCGPAPFMAAVRDMLESLGFDLTRYHEESFDAPALVEVPVEPSPPPGAAQIEFALSGITTDCQGDDTVLAVARQAGLNIPSGCQFGLCGTCKVLKREGEVLMVHNGGISEEEIAEGYILACCARPQGLVSVEV
ncbi:hybrid-cluster NAD(P)-dependent oxidoreductase [uncultured Paracoccus sp.]|uniref:hybrid-cluster NAD(P)-dependent oxidoreductase n=1 Tax=uncultured Paracoccus sp. TaxID=189685 RepID=UPI00261858AF|nr:hybrid-cluster NAD(P)-dependent oxidoreductase [uncultured Paracoccus sp.]